LAIGIVQVNGSFQRGSVVSLYTPSGEEIGRGLCNYPSTEVAKIMGQGSEKIAGILGHRPYESVIHRNNLALITTPDA
jgi:glutamate 5-kinase